ncbi:transposase-like protein [Acidocella aromatica]|uniref:Transposase-like protein n=1 Tax=Acidocella aromatica TaxID=1303579 RepID=A0A840V7S5_9PROT|nr:transposase-like protein [Acidocella aromatica]
MKQSKYSEAQILAILRQADGGVPVAELCRERGMSDASFYKWRAKYGGMDASMISSMKSLADENRRLKKMVAELSMQNELLKEALAKIAGRGETRGQHRAGLPGIWGERNTLSLCAQAGRRERRDPDLLVGPTNAKRGWRLVLSVFV